MYPKWAGFLYMFPRILIVDVQERQIYKFSRFDDEVYIQRPLTHSMCDTNISVHL